MGKVVDPGKMLTNGFTRLSLDQLTDDRSPSTSLNTWRHLFTARNFADSHSDLIPFVKPPELQQHRFVLIIVSSVQKLVAEA